MTTDGVTLLSVVLILSLMIVGAFVKKKLREDSKFYFQGHCYQVVGIGVVDDKGSYVPVYKELK